MELEIVSKPLVKCVKIKMDADDSDLSKKEKLIKSFNDCVKTLGIKTAKSK